jgi:hypothetical protein
MKRFLSWLTISLLVVSCATHEAATHPVLIWHGETATWDPHYGPYGGYHFSSGVSAQNDPTLGPHSGVRFSNGVTAEYDPSLAKSGIRLEDFINDAIEERTRFIPDLSTRVK